MVPLPSLHRGGSARFGETFVLRQAVGHGIERRGESAYRRRFIDAETAMRRVHTNESKFVRRIEPNMPRRFMMRSDPDIDGHRADNVLAMAGVDVQPTCLRPRKQNSIDGGEVAHSRKFQQS